MPANTYPDALDDLLNTTVKNYHRHKNRWSDISMNFPKYMFAEKFLKAKRTTTDGGTHVIWDVQHDNSGTLREVGMFSQDANERNNIMIQGEAKWASQNIGIYFDLNEGRIGRGLHRIVNHIEAQIHSMYNRYFEGMSIKLWTSPASTADADRKLLGLTHWIVKNATEGFNGGNPAGFSGVGAGNIDSDTYTTWKNWSGTYAQVSDEDLLEKASTMHDRCDFRTPHNYAAAVKEGHDVDYITTHSVTQKLRRLQKAQNDNIGRDLGVYKGEVLFRGVPVMTSWELSLDKQSNGTDNPAYDATNPFYGIHWPSFKFCFLRGAERELDGPRRHPTMRKVRLLDLDSWNQLYCLDRRRSGVLYEA